MFQFYFSCLRKFVQPRQWYCGIGNGRKCNHSNVHVHNGILSTRVSKSNVQTEWEMDRVSANML